MFSRLGKPVLVKFVQYRMEEFLQSIAVIRKLYSEFGQLRRTIIKIEEQDGLSKSSEKLK
jgi:hypothetical protein